MSEPVKYGLFSIQQGEGTLMLHKNTPSKGYVTLSWSVEGDEDGEDSVAMVLAEDVFDHICRQWVGYC